MLLSNAIKFQKTLALAASASNTFEAEAAELAARRLIEMLRINPTVIPDASLYNRMNFGDNELLKKLRSEWQEQHPRPAALRLGSKQPKLDIFADVEPGNNVSVEDVYQGPSIPFNIEGFRRHTRKNRTRKQAVQLTTQDHETIRTLLNKGLGLTAIANKIGYSRDTINSTRAYHIRSGKWVRRDGQLDWSRPLPGADADKPTAEGRELKAERMNIVAIIKKHLTI